MIKHIVMIQLKEKNTENIEKVKNALLGLKKIRILQELEVGVDFMGSERSMDLILTTAFNNLEDFETYRTHPDHLPVLDLIKGLASMVKVVDYEL